MKTAVVSHERKMRSHAPRKNTNWGRWRTKFWVKRSNRNGENYTMQSIVICNYSSPNSFNNSLTCILFRTYVRLAPGLCRPQPTNQVKRNCQLPGSRLELLDSSPSATRLPRYGEVSRHKNKKTTYLIRIIAVPAGSREETVAFIFVSERTV
jgi:hypothetical protein